METTEIPTPQGQSQQVNPQQQEMSEDTKTIITVLTLVVFYPAGLVMMWVWTKWQLWVKWVVTAAGCILPLIILIVFGSVIFAIFQDPTVKAEIQSEIERNSSSKMQQSDKDDLVDIEKSVKDCNETCDKYAGQGRGAANCKLSCEALRQTETN